jgi:DNA-binding NarL/FixJ family response regulator
MGAAPLILVADADHSCRKLITGLLGRIAFETTEAKTGPETLELVQRLRPALVLLEINLPEVSGYEVCRELRDDFGDEISVIFLSGERTTSSDRVAGLLVGASLTIREREVLRLLARGLNQTDIAARLLISPKTVGGHIQRILAKLGVHSRAQAVAVAHEQGLADVEGHGLVAAFYAL